jgi:hypothetical protein
MEANMDMRKYAAKYIKPDHVRDGPIQTRIVNVFDGRYGAVLELENGSQFPLNVGNTNTLITAWGTESDDWIEQEVALELGTYKDWNQDPPVEKETVKIRAVSPPKGAAAQNGATPPANKPALPASRIPPPPLKDDMSDDIPF